MLVHCKGISVGPDYNTHPSILLEALYQTESFVLCAAYFKEPGCAYSDELEETVMALQSDKDRDVRFFASLDPNKGLMDTAPLI